MADDTVDERLARIESAISDLRGKMATKADLASAIAGVAQDADITLLQQSIERSIAETHAARADLRDLTATVQLLIDHHRQLSDRIGALETRDGH